MFALRQAQDFANLFSSPGVYAWVGIPSKQAAPFRGPGLAASTGRKPFDFAQDKPRERGSKRIGCDRPPRPEGLGYIKSAPAQIETLPTFSLLRVRPRLSGHRPPVRILVSVE